MIEDLRGHDKFVSLRLLDDRTQAGLDIGVIVDDRAGERILDTRAFGLCPCDRRNRRRQLSQRTAS